MKIIVAGSRGFNNYDVLSRVLDTLTVGLDNEDLEVVSGTARGADKIGERYARDRGISIKKFPAEWDTHGKSAGYLRNRDMADYADACVVFWDGESKGSKHMIELAEKAGLHLRVINYVTGEEV